MTRFAPALTALALCLVATEAGAIEIYASPPGVMVIPPPVIPPPRVVVVETPPPPVVVIRTPPPPVVVVRTLPPPVVTTVGVAPPPVVNAPPSHPQPEERRDPRASLFVGMGYGGMTGLQSGAAGVMRLHVGLGLGATEFGLRASIANRALDTLSTSPGGVWLLSAEVAHRFLSGSTVRPVLGASFDRWQIEPEERSSAGAFGVGARGGFEIHYSLHPGAALVFGVDATYHRILSSVDNVPVLPDVLTFGATVDIRL